MIYPFLFFGLVLLFLIATWRNPRRAIFLLFACLPAYLLRLDVFGMPTTLLEWMLGMAMLAWLTDPVRQKIDGSFLRGWRLPLFLFFLASLVGFFVAPDKLVALGIWKAYVIEPVFFFLLVRISLRWYDDAQTVVMALGCGAAVVAAFAIFQSVTGLGIPIPWDVERRVTSVYPYPNAVGLYVGPIILLGLAALSRGVKERIPSRIFFWILVLGLCVAAVIFSQTEAVWGAVPAAVLVLMIGLFPRLRLLAVPLALAGILVMLAVPALRTKALLHDYSGEVRRKQWTETAEMLKDRWAFGAGLSGYPAVMAAYHVFPEIEIFQYPHNIFLNIWSEFGLLGFLVLAMLTWRVLRLYRKADRERSPMLWLTFGCVAALVEMFLHGFVDVPYFKNDLALLTWGIFALLSWSATGRFGEPEKREGGTI